MLKGKTTRIGWLRPTVHRQSSDVGGAVERQGKERTIMIGILSQRPDFHVTDHTIPSLTVWDSSEMRFRREQECGVMLLIWSPG